MKCASLTAGNLRGRLGVVILVRWLWTPLTLCALVAILSIVTARTSETLQRIVIVALITLIAEIGLYIFVGNSGVLSFGHVSFMAIGAYVSALLTIPVALKHRLLASAPDFLIEVHVSTVPATLIAGGAACVFALVVAIPLMRLAGLAAGIGTFAVLVIVNVVVSNWNAVTRGQQTMVGVPIDTSLRGTLVWTWIAIGVAYVFQKSKVGLRLRGSREDIVAARAIGIGVFRERTAAFVLGAFFVGVAGALYAHFYGSISPDAFYLSLTFIMMVMLVTGGINSLSGAVVGSVVVSVVTELLRRFEQGVNIASLHITAPQGSQQIGLAVFLLAILIFRPAGIVGGNELSWPFGRASTNRGRAPT